MERLVKRREDQENRKLVDFLYFNDLLKNNNVFHILFSNYESSAGKKNCENYGKKKGMIAIPALNRYLVGMMT